MGVTLTDGLGMGAETERILLGVKACAQSWRAGRSWKGEESEVGNGKINPEWEMGCANMQRQGRILQGQGKLSGAGCSGH